MEQELTARRSRNSAVRSAAVATGVLVACGVVLWLFLSLYASRGYASPIQQDTLKYVWRSRLMQADGFSAIAGVPAGTTVQPDRPGLPALASLVDGVLHVSPYRLMFVLAPVAAVLIGLAAGALMVRATGEPGWAWPVYVLAVGASVNAMLMAVGYLDNILAAAALTAAAATGLLAADGRRGVVATGLLIVGAAMIHWQFTALFVAILGGVTVLLVPESFLAWRRGRRMRDTAAVRLGAGVLGGAVGVGAVMLAEPTQLSKTSRFTFLHELKVTRDAYRFRVVGPAAAAGMAAVAIPPRTRRLRTLALLVVWGLSAFAAYELLEHRTTIAAHRFIAFALAIPILAAATLVGIARVLGALAGMLHGRIARRAAQVVAALVGGGLVIGALVAQTAVSRNEWYARAHPAFNAFNTTQYPSYPPTEARALAEAARAGAYVARDGRGRPVIFVAQAPGLPTAVTALGIVRDVIPPDQIPRTALYVGQVQNLLKGRPTLTGIKAQDHVSLKFWEGSRPLARRAIVLELRSFDPRLVVPKKGHPDPGRWIAPGVWLVRGPAPTARIPSIEPPAAPTPLALVLTSLGFLALLAAAGAGWSWWLLDDRPARVALAPAFGVVVLAVAGVLVDRFGARLSGGVAWTLVVVVAVLGWAWVPFAMRKRRRVRADGPEAPRPTAQAKAGEAHDELAAEAGTG